MNPVVVAARGKGITGAARRVAVIGRRYGPTAARMDAAIGRFMRILKSFEATASFPITAAALSRTEGIVEKYDFLGVEFPVHGYFHVDHTRLSLQAQLDQLGAAKRLFEKRGLRPEGFRSPYLRASEDTLTVLRTLGFRYDSSQAVAFPVEPAMQTDAYRRALELERARPVEDIGTMPRSEDGLLRIPYALPDDEALVDRLRIDNANVMSRIWLDMLERTHVAGELFTLNLHPERIANCEAALIATLARARQLSPAVWIARLGDIARWWTDLAATSVEATRLPHSGELEIHVAGPRGVTVLARGMEVRAITSPWLGREQVVHATVFRVTTQREPFVGVSPTSDPALPDLLRERGYIVDLTSEPRRNAVFLNEPILTPERTAAILAKLGAHAGPLLRISRWPEGAASAMSVTGDIDALTVWDYGLRVVGR